MLKKIAKKLVRMFYPNLFPDPPIDISDESVNWICFANAGILDRGNLYSFDFALRNLPPDEGAILEIGSFCGLSTNLINHYRMKHGITNRFFNCDKWEFEGAEPGQKISGLNIGHSEYKNFVRQTYIRNLQMFSGADLPHTVEMLSDQFFEAWERKAQIMDVFGRSVQLGGELCFCYIDGNHSYEFAKRDFQNCDRWLKKGGFILFDDSGDGTPFGVKGVIEELKTSGRYEVVIKNPNYLFRKN